MKKLLDAIWEPFDGEDSSRVVPTDIRLHSISIYSNWWSDRMDLTVLLLVAMFLVYMYVNDRDDWRG